jgi:hypothetical protein
MASVVPIIVETEEAFALVVQNSLLPMIHMITERLG